jgi:phosphate transport system permease protein
MEGSLLNLQSKQIFNTRLKTRSIKGALFYGIFLVSVCVGIIALGTLLIQVVSEGWSWLTWHFLFDYPSRHPEEAGMMSAIFGTLWVMFMTGIIAIPVGIGSAMFLEEYAPKTKLMQLVEINLANLAGVPSIVYGLLGLAVFVYWMNLGRTALAGSLTLALLVLPVIILASREAVRSVPSSHRDAAYALGADKWQIIRMVVFPGAFPGILTGSILALSRAIGEAAPVIAISALVYITFIPTSPMDRFTVMPIQIYNWVSRPQEEFQNLAAAGIIVLLVVLLSMNALAIFLRNKYQARSDE